MFAHGKHASIFRTFGAMGLPASKGKAQQRSG
jgi:hypothetical protein